MLRAWLGPFPGPVARMGLDLIRSDPQFSNPFSPTQQVWSTSYNYEVANARYLFTCTYSRTRRAQASKAAVLLSISGRL